MEKSDQKFTGRTSEETEFFRLMCCGHGRCVSMLQENLQLYYEAVMYGCLNDISYDIQCEGSRGNYMYILASLYKDSLRFLDAAICKLQSGKADEDWNTLCHLCDFIVNYAYNGEKTADNALEEGYNRLLEQIMTTRASKKHKKFVESFEYIIIVLMQRKNFDRLEAIIKDIGAYFIRRKHAAAVELQSDFLWFFQCAKEKYGEGFTQKLDASKPEIQKFIRVMKAKKTYVYPAQMVPNIDEICQKASGGNLYIYDKIRFGRKASAEEKYRLAEIALSEQDKEKKAALLSMFASKYNIFPLDPKPLIKYAVSDNSKLKEAAFSALVYVKSDLVHNFAIQLLDNIMQKNECETSAVPKHVGNYSIIKSSFFEKKEIENRFQTAKTEINLDALYMLITNYTETDFDLLIHALALLEIDFENESGWHSIVSYILDKAPNSFLPDKALYFIYEKSFCSCCRKEAVEQMHHRGILTKELLKECCFDCNEEVRNIGKSLSF